MVASSASAVNMPASPETGASTAPDSADGPPASATIGWEVGCRCTASPPGRTCNRKPIALHIVPDGRNTAAGLPSSVATRSHRTLTVGSSPRCSSPTFADAMAVRIASTGRVWVSEYRLISVWIASSLSVDRQRWGWAVQPSGGDHQLQPAQGREVLKWGAGKDEQVGSELPGGVRESESIGSLNGGAAAQRGRAHMSTALTRSMMTCGLVATT